MTTIIEIEKRILDLEKEKKATSRRINYRIRQLKEMVQKVVNGEEVEDLVLEEVPATTEAPAPAKPVDQPVEKVEKTFEIAFDENCEYDVFFNNVWHPIGFFTLKEGDVIRVRDMYGKVLKFYDSKFLTPVGYPNRNRDGLSVIRVKVFAF